MKSIAAVDNRRPQLRYEAPMEKVANNENVRRQVMEEVLTNKVVFFLVTSANIKHVPEPEHTHDHSHDEPGHSHEPEKAEGKKAEGKEKTKAKA